MQIKEQHGTVPTEACGFSSKTMPEWVPISSTAGTDDLLKGYLYILSYSVYDVTFSDDQIGRAALSS